MQAIGYSEARNNLKTIMDIAYQSYEPVVITRKNRQNIVLMSLEEYNAIQETMYLLSTKNNRDRLLESIDEIEKGNFRQKELVEN